MFLVAVQIPKPVDEGSVRIDFTPRQLPVAVLLVTFMRVRRDRLVPAGAPAFRAQVIDGVGARPQAGNRARIEGKGCNKKREQEKTANRHHPSAHLCFSVTVVQAVGLHGGVWVRNDLILCPTSQDFNA